jgi:exopolysaccharide biosynthesis protein
MPDFRIATPAMSAVAIFSAATPGVSHREAQMAPAGPLSHVRAIIITIDPAAFRFRLALARKNEHLNPAWNIDSIPRNAVVAVNAGQFVGGFPWGWLVRDGIETLPPGKGTLAMAFVIDSSERVSLITPDEIPALRTKILHAFQSYPALLVDGEMPWELREEGRGVNLTHRDSRLAICVQEKGALTIVLTRVTMLGDPGATLPYGPTVPEMAQYMRTLGCRRAMMLDGGISSQLAIRDGSGKLKRWTNWRMVPLGLVAFPRN